MPRPSLWPRAQSASRPSPLPRAQSAPRPSPWPRAHSTPSLSLWPRAQSTPRPSPDLDVRLLTHGGRTPDATWATLPTPCQSTSPTVSPTPVPVTPHLRYCEYGMTVRGMGGVNPRHYCHTLAVTALLLQDGVQGLGSDGHNPNRARRRRQQERPRRCPYHKDMSSDLHSVDTITPLHTEDRLPNLHM